jgi:hypothetical protein
LRRTAVRRCVAGETDPHHCRFESENCRNCDSRNWVRKLAGYRLYCLDGANKVASGEWIEADDDEAAIEAARERHDGYECEVWQGRRLVARVDFRRSG